MTADRKRLKELGLEMFSGYFDNVESQYLNLIQDPVTGKIMDRKSYEKGSSMMEWRCAICGDDIMSDRGRTDAENFVCERCSERYNNSSPLIDRRIMDSRTKFFKCIEDRLYDILEDRLNGGKM